MKPGEILRWLGVYALWAFSVALAIAFFPLSRQAMFIAMDLARASQVSRAAVDRFFLLLVAVLLIVYIVFSEHFYRTGFLKGRLTARAAAVTGIELFLIFLLQGFRVVVVGTAGSPFPWILVGFEGSVGVALVYVSISQSRKRRRAARKPVSRGTTDP